MVKKSKRKQDIKSKLVAAVAMLMVATIMMVSSTYAWFTLSTAPEIQGITTNVGANGSLEIALAPFGGDLSQIRDAEMGETDWVDKNLTWGNLLDLSDASYGLAEITLLPSRLNITAGTQQKPAHLSSNMLMVPVYGADGRINKLDASKVQTGIKNPDKGVDGFVVPGQSEHAYGVHAVGTSSTMSPTVLNFKNALASINDYRGKANNLVITTMEKYGTSLGDVAIMHGTKLKDQKPDDNNYGPYVADMKAMTADMKSAAKAIETALYNALLALANTKDVAAYTFDVTVDETTTQMKAYDYIKNQMDAGIPLDTVWGALKATGKFTTLETAAPKLTAAFKAWQENNTAINNTEAKLNAITDTTNVTWDQISPALNGLMNVDKVTVNNKNVSDLDVADVMSGSITMKLLSGSGVISNFAELTGNIATKIILSENAQYAGQSLKGVPINIVAAEPTEGPMLTQSRNEINGMELATDENEVNTIDTTYGYALDFVFRTNAAASNLLLQTKGVQRVYEDSTNTETLGKGSTISFKGDDLDSLVSMMSGIRVVFIPMMSEDLEVYGIAKVVFDETLLSISAKPVTGVMKQDATDTNKYELEITEDANAAAELIKLALTADGNGNITQLSTVKEFEGGKLVKDEHTYIVREVVENDDGTTYERWTVKTAMYYTRDLTITVGSGESAAVTTATDEIELVGNDGKPIFYPEKRDGESDEDYQARVLDLAKTAKNYPDTDEELEGPVEVDEENATVTFKVNNLETQLVDTRMQKPVYYHVDTQEIELEGELYLHNYSVSAAEGENTAGKLVFGEAMDVQVLCSLSQNVPTGVTALVYLDGDYIRNSDVANSEDGISNTGKLNLQFASSATLVPMENTDLFNGTTAPTT